MPLLKTATASLCLALASSTLAGPHCQTHCDPQPVTESGLLIVEVSGHAQTAAAPGEAFMSFDQAELASALKRVSLNRIQQIQKQILAKRGDVGHQMAALEQAAVTKVNGHYFRPNHRVKFTAGHYGQVHQFVVTGTKQGIVWGTDTYTSDSTLGAAAVHAGVLKEHETGVVTIRVVKPLTSYTRSTRHGVYTLDWSHWDGAYEFITDQPTGSLFASFDQLELQAALEAINIDPVEQIRQQVLANRVAAQEQFAELQEGIAKLQQSLSEVSAIDYRQGTVHVKGDQYPIRVSLLSNGELKTRVQLFRLNRRANAYELSEVHDTEHLPQQVTARIQQITHDFIQSFPNHSPELAALTLQTR